MYPAGEAPGQYLVFDEEKQARTPVYSFGWVISRSELYEALFNRKTVLELSLSLIDVGANRRFFALWTEMGYDVNEYKWVFFSFEFLHKLNC